jgi:hypothetical protein
MINVAKRVIKYKTTPTLKFKTLTITYVASEFNKGRQSADIR